MSNNFDISQFDTENYITFFLQQTKLSLDVYLISYSEQSFFMQLSIISVE